MKRESVEGSGKWRRIFFFIVGAEEILSTTRNSGEKKKKKRVRTLVHLQFFRVGN